MSPALLAGVRVGRLVERSQLYSMRLVTEQKTVRQLLYVQPLHLV